jgi:DNA polymerase-1
VANGFEVNAKLEDTRVLAYLNWPHLKHGLKALTKIKLKRPVVELGDLSIKPHRKFVKFFENNPKFFKIGDDFFNRERVIDYAKADVTNCDDLRKAMHVTSWWREHEMPLTSTLFQMERRGINLDLDKLRSLDAEYTSRVDNLTAFFHPTNPNSSKQLAKRLEEEGFDLSSLAEKTEKGAPKLDKLFFKQLAWSGSEFADKLLSYRRYYKNLNTYIRPLLEYSKKDGRVHGSFNQAGVEDMWGEGGGGTSTGRLTSSGPNLQNIPARTKEGKEVRSCFVATKGFTLFDADLKQIEPRLVAHYSQAPKLLKAYNEGLDTHGMFASDIFHKPIEELTKIERFIGKTSWLATVYGCSYRKLLLICESNSDEPLTIDTSPYKGIFDRMDVPTKKKILRYAPLCDDDMYSKWMFFKHVQDEFKKANPEIMSWRSHQITRTKLLGHVVTIGGRRISIPDLHSEDRAKKAAAERQAVNFQIQGSAADVMKMVMSRFQKDFVDAGKGFMLASVHDEILGEFPDTQDPAETMALVNDIMCNTVKLKNVPIDSDSKIIANWSEK